MLLAPRPQAQLEKTTAHIYNYVLSSEQGATAEEIADYMFRVHSDIAVRDKIYKSISNLRSRGFFISQQASQPGAKVRYKVAPYAVYLEERKRRKETVRPPLSQDSNSVAEQAVETGVPPVPKPWAPKPKKPSSWAYRLYEVVETLGGAATLEQIEELLPATLSPGEKAPTTKRLKNSLLNNATNHGYFIKQSNGHGVTFYCIAPKPYWQEQRKQQKAYEANRSRRLGGKPRRKRRATVVSAPAPAPAAKPAPQPVANTIPDLVALVDKLHRRDRKLMLFVGAASLFSGAALSFALWISLG